MTSAARTTDPARASSDDAGLDYRFTHREILRVLSGVLLCIFLAAIDQTVVIPAVPAMAADLNGFSHLSWIVSAYLLTATAATPRRFRMRATSRPPASSSPVSTTPCASMRSRTVSRSRRGT